jgi:PEP-CTERM motif-containing protein
MRRVLLIAFVAFAINIGTRGSATASEILFLAPQFPCGGTPGTVLTCFPGGFGFPIEWGGPNYVPIQLPANSLIEEIDLWGEATRAVGIWDRTTLPPPFPPVVIPRHELAAIAPGSIDVTTTLFGIDGINGAGYFFYQGMLHNPIFLQNEGLYYVGVGGFGMVGGSGVVWHTSGFATDVDPLTLSSTIPGVAIQVVGQVVPEPSTVVLLGLGMMLLCLRRVDILHLPRRYCEMRRRR